MLKSIRKFSNSIFAKIFLAIIAIPFIFWGMGPVFQGGKKNVIVEIGKEKISTQKFIDFVRFHSTNEKVLDKKLIEKLLSNFVGEKLIVLESENLNIRLSDISLSTVIRNEKIFKKENKFSRIEYEKFLVKNSQNAASFEANISKQVKKEQLFNFIGGGIIPSNFLVNITYDKINQKRNIQVINLNDVFKQKLKFSIDQVKSYFEQNKNTFKNIYKSVKFIQLNPKNLTGRDEYNDLFFQIVDEIDDLIVEGKNLNYILNKFNLGSASSANFNKLGKNKNSKIINDFPNELIADVFNINEAEPTALIEHKDKYFIVEVTKIENIQKEISDETVKKEILSNLKKQTKRKLIAEIISKINKNNFKKDDFDKLSKDKNIVVKKIKLKNRNDDIILKKELIKQIYAYPEKKVIVVADINLSEIFLIYIDKIENASIDKNHDDYKTYSHLSKIKIANSLYNTYDSYLRNKYKININYNALDNVKNYFR